MSDTRDPKDAGLHRFSATPSRSLEQRPSRLAELAAAVPRHRSEAEDHPA